jgi:molybdopterin/thiamine biosynthesis adenylyltransferase/nitroreductase
MHANLHDLNRSPDARVGFDYSAAFSRNIGWVTEWEQKELRKKTVAIAGLGGVGGAHALTLARLGIGGLHLADMDRFDVVNLNRQAGAFISTVNLEKSQVMADMSRDINPELRQTIFPHGINGENLDAFLNGVDLFVDGLDFFVIDIRRKVFKRCAELGIPAITAGPIGFGTSYLIFMPGEMSFEEYFRFEGLSRERQYVNFAVGLTPRGFHRGYMVDPSRIDLAGKRGPSTAAAIQLCAGIVGAEAIKILLGRGKVHAAPAYHQFDAYRGRWHRGYLRSGNAGPLQSLKRLIGYKAFGVLSRNARPAEAAATGSEVERILDLTRWAPSGDNSQPWRFEVVGGDKILVHLHVAGQDHNIYDYADGQPTLLSGGFLLETMRIAASRFGRSMQWTYLGSEKHEAYGMQHTIEALLAKDSTITEDPLCNYLTIRSVDRRPFQKRPLTQAQKDALESAIGPDLKLEWRETPRERWRLARLCARSTDIRLRLPEAHAVHTRILDWNRAFSPDGVPAAAVGIDAMTLRLMRWVMQRWTRVDVMNRYFAGTAMPRIQLDLIPGMASAAYFVVSCMFQPAGPHTPTSLLQTGERLQRFWLTATSLGLAVQPALAPLCFVHYGQNTHSSSRRLANLAKASAQCFAADGSVVFLGRIGTPRRNPPIARSIRRDLSDLIFDGARSIPKSI